MAKPFKVGDSVRVTDGKHAWKSGVVTASDKKITAVNFNGVIDPVWTTLLEKAN